MSSLPVPVADPPWISARFQNLWKLWKLGQWNVRGLEYSQWKWMYENSYIWTAEETMNKWMIIAAIHATLSSCEKKAWKKFRLERDSNPWPLRYRCSALRTNWAIKPTGSWSLYEFVIYPFIQNECSSLNFFSGFLFADHSFIQYSQWRYWLKKWRSWYLKVTFSPGIPGGPSSPLGPGGPAGPGFPAAPVSPGAPLSP